MTVAASFLIQESTEAYQAKAAEYLSSHQLADFRRCPLLYRKKKLGVIEDEDRPAYLLGRALHTLVLEGRDTFEDQYAVGGPVNPKTGRLYGSKTKAFAQWAAEQGRPVLTLEQFDLIEQMAEAVEQHELAEELLRDGIPEAVVRADYCELPCQARMDWFDPHAGLVELKTCDDPQRAGPSWRCRARVENTLERKLPLPAAARGCFESDARRYGYVHQVAFYQAVLSQVIGLAMPVHLIAVEKKQPFRTGVWKVHEEVLAQARQENQSAMQRLRECMAADSWPSGYEQCRVFDRL